MKQVTEGTFCNECHKTYKKLHLNHKCSPQNKYYQRFKKENISSQRKYFRCKYCKIQGKQINKIRHSDICQNPCIFKTQRVQNYHKKQNKVKYVWNGESYEIKSDNNLIIQCYPTNFKQNSQFIEIIESNVIKIQTQNTYNSKKKQNNIDHKISIDQNFIFFQKNQIEKIYQSDSLMQKPNNNKSMQIRQTQNFQKNGQIVIKIQTQNTQNLQHNSKKKQNNIDHKISIDQKLIFFQKNQIEKIYQSDSSMQKPNNNKSMQIRQTQNFQKNEQIEDSQSNQIWQPAKNAKKSTITMQTLIQQNNDNQFYQQNKIIVQQLQQQIQPQQYQKAQDYLYNICQKRKDKQFQPYQKMLQASFLVGTIRYCGCWDRNLQGWKQRRTTIQIQPYQKMMGSWYPLLLHGKSPKIRDFQRIWFQMNQKGATCNLANIVCRLKQIAQFVQWSKIQIEDLFRRSNKWQNKQKIKHLVDGNINWKKKYRIKRKNPQMAAIRKKISKYQYRNSKRYRLKTIQHNKSSTSSVGWIQSLQLARKRKIRGSRVSTKLKYQGLTQLIEKEDQQYYLQQLLKRGAKKGHVKQYQKKKSQLMKMLFWNSTADFLTICEYLMLIVFAPNAQQNSNSPMLVVKKWLPISPLVLKRNLKDCYKQYSKQYPNQMEIDEFEKQLKQEMQKRNILAKSGHDIMQQLSALQAWQKSLSHTKFQSDKFPSNIKSGYLDRNLVTREHLTQKLVVCRDCDEFIESAHSYKCKVCDVAICQFCHQKAWICWECVYMKRNKLQIPSQFVQKRFDYQYPQFKQAMFTNPCIAELDLFEKIMNTSNQQFFQNKKRLKVRRNIFCKQFIFYPLWNNKFSYLHPDDVEIVKGYRNRKYNEPLVIQESTIKNAGNGCFATRDIIKGQMICQYTGDVIPQSRINAEDQTYCFQFCNGPNINKKFCIVPIKHWSIAMMINSKKKNANATAITAFSLQGPHIIIQALRHIKRAEEIFYDYGKFYRK